jgi:hypothetical protein
MTTTNSSDVAAAAEDPENRADRQHLVAVRSDGRGVSE